MFAVGLVTAGTAAAVQASPPSADGVEVSNAAAAQAVDAFVKSKPSVLQPSTDDAYVQKSVTAFGNSKYVAYDRTYKGLPVVGGDFVVVTDKSGATTYTSVAQSRAIGNLSTTAKISSAAAEAVARKQLTTVQNVEGTRLVVYTLDGAAKLAYETTLSGLGAQGVSRLSVDVDANSGALLHKQEHVTEGTGTGWINGSVTINTTLSGSTYSMKDPSITSLSCQDAANNTTFSGSDDVWGNGVGTNKETGCVDALYVAQGENQMLQQWLGRSTSFNGSGGGWPLRVGLNDQNAYYDGTQVQIGKNTAGQWISSADVVGHELGHGIDDHTGSGGVSGGNTQEFVADTFGAATEWFLNNPNDPPDYQVGEEVNLVGSGPIRYMYNPSLAGDDNCWSSSTASEEVHAAAGPGNHWFYLMAQGSAGNGQPSSPTCNSSTVGNPLGIQNAIKIMYNAMLMKTSTASYGKYRTWTLTAAKNLFPGSCTQFNTVKAAWDAVSLPAQSGDPTCTSGTTPPPTTSSPTPTSTGGGGGCSGQKLLNPGFESGTANWSGTTGTIGAWGSSGEPAHSGSYSSWLDGYGSTHTEGINQSVTIPAGCNATLSFYVHIDTAETTTTTQYDKLTISAGGTTLGTMSNLNKASGYQYKTYSLSAFAGQTVNIQWSGSEDSSLQTSFVIDDTAVTLS